MAINIKPNILMEMIEKQEELGYEINYIHGYTIELESGFVDFLSYFGNRLMDEGSYVTMTNVTDDWGIFIEFCGPSYCAIRQGNDKWRNEGRSLANLIAFGFSKRDLWRSGFFVEPETYNLLKIYDVEFCFAGKEPYYNNTIFDLGDGKYLVDRCLVVNAENVAKALYKYLRKTNSFRDKISSLYILKVTEREVKVI